MPSTKRVLLVEQDAMLRASLAEQLRAGDLYAPVEVASFAAGMAEGQDGTYEFCVVDARLPDGDGAELVRAWRGAGMTCPIILLTENTGAVAAADCGANDVLAKPFRFAVMMARVNAHLRSHARTNETEDRIGPYVFRPHAKILIEGAKRIRLTEKETDILKYLSRAGETVSREILLHEVWGYNPTVTTHTLETHIYRLRRKIEKDGSAQLLLTEEGGYRLAV